MNIPDDVQASIEAFAGRFHVPQKSDVGFSDETRRAWTMNLVSHLAFAHGKKWGTKSADTGRPISKDSLAYNGDVVYGFDIVNGSTMTLQFPRGIDLTNPNEENNFTAPQHFVAAGESDRFGNTVPAARDWLDGTAETPIPGEPGTTPTQPPPASGAEIDLLKAIRDALAPLAERMGHVEATVTEATMTLVDKANQLVSKVDDLQKDVQSVRAIGELVKQQIDAGIKVRLR